LLTRIEERKSGNRKRNANRIFACKQKGNIKKKGKKQTNKKRERERGKKEESREKRGNRTDPVLRDYFDVE